MGRASLFIASLAAAVAGCRGADTLHVNAGAAPLPTTLVPQFAVIRLQ